MKQHHKIEIFSANCPLCKHIIDDIQIGKCEGCSQIVYDLTKMTEEIKVKMKDLWSKSSSYYDYRWKYQSCRNP
jgi:hypothetical protein